VSLSVERPAVSLTVERPAVSLSVEGPAVSLSVEGPAVSLSVEGPAVSLSVERSILIDGAQRFHQSEIRNPKSQIKTCDFKEKIRDELVSADMI